MRVTAYLCTKITHNIEFMNKTNCKNEIPFEAWPLDLLIDYVLKIHHRNIRSKGPALLQLTETVRASHAPQHPELNELAELVNESLYDLELHLQKEENVLFPYLYELFEASQNGRSIEGMHCGTIANPIRVMNMEHEAESNRYLHIRQLTHDFRIPEDANDNYKRMLAELEEFVDALMEHIHVENDIIFPGFLSLEERFVRR